MLCKELVILTSLTEFIHLFSGIREEDLLLENTAMTAAADKPAEEDQPVPPHSEDQDGVTLPEPPVVAEASGTGDLDNLLWPDTTQAAQDTEDVVVLEEEHLDNGVDTEDLLVSETADDDFVPEVLSEAAEEGGSKPPEELLVEEPGVEEAAESDGQTPEEAPASAPVPLEEPPESSEIASDDIADDDILLVNQDAPSVRIPLSPAPPTAMSAEKESTFTEVSLNGGAEGFKKKKKKMTPIDIHSQETSHYSSDPKR